MTGIVKLCWHSGVEADVPSAKLAPYPAWADDKTGKFRQSIGFEVLVWKPKAIWPTRPV
jgi:hypothetical protein